MANNPLILNLPAETGGFVSCNAHAAYYQRLTIMAGNQQLGVFTGSGENVPMTSNGQKTVSLPADSSASELSFKFEFSPTGPNGPFQSASVQDPTTNTYGDITIVNITSEDRADNDDNDTYATLVYYTGNGHQQ